MVRRGLLLFLFFGALIAPTVARAQLAATPPAGAWLRYRYEQRLLYGTGAYEGYHEITVARARYDVVSADQSSATIRGRYAWSYSSPERTDSGVEDRTVSFSLPGRRYLSAQTDVSDYDERSGRVLATWIWIPPTVQVSDTVEILERDFRVSSTDVSIEAAGGRRRAILLEANANDARHDAYGSLSTAIIDRYWYDAVTGMFLREVHEERASGSLDGSPAAFTLHTTIELVDSSYAPAADPVPDEDYGAPPPAPSLPPSSSGGTSSSTGGIGGRFSPWWMCLGLMFSIAVALLVARIVRRRRIPSLTASGERFRVDVPNERLSLRGLSPFFDPFLPHMVRVAEAAKHPVAVATTPAGAVIGVALGDKDAAVGTIFAKDSDVCEALRLKIGQTEFFSEVRHETLASVKKLGLTAPAEAYNVYETYELMHLTERPAELDYDTDVISRLKDEHRPAVIALLDAVYGVSNAAWFGASLREGDVAWVAEEEGRVVGVAMASIVGSRARLHTLTVHPDHRNRGLGTALFRARLRALFDMGIEHVITEVATWNVAALELARAHGFVKAGVMYVESARSQRDERKFVRR